MLMFFFFGFFPLDASGNDRKVLATLFAAEQFVGRCDWSWNEVAEQGLSLNRDEARSYLMSSDSESPLSFERQSLYDYLFERHPELKLSAFIPDEIKQKFSSE